MHLKNKFLNIMGTLFNLNLTFFLEKSHREMPTQDRIKLLIISMKIGFLIA